MTSQRTQCPWDCFGLLWFLVLFCTKNISAIAMICNIELHVQCIWSVETESNGSKEIVLFWRTLYLSAKLFTALRLRLCTRNLVSWIIKRSFEQFLFQRRFISWSRISTREKEIRFESLPGHQIPVCHSCNVSHRRLAQLVKNVQHCTFQNCKVL